MRAAIGPLVAVAAVLGAAPAPAQAGPQRAPEPVRLEYDASAGGATCPDASLLRNVVASHLGGRDPFTQDGQRRITVTIRQRGRAFVAVAAMYDAAGASVGDREMAQGNCTSLVETMGEIVATWLAPLPRLRPHVASPAKAPELTKPESAHEPTKPEPPPEPTKPAPAPRPRPRVVVELGPVVSFGALPGPAAFGVAGAVGARWPMFSIALGVQGEPPTTSTSKDTSPPTDVRAFRVVGTLAPCVHVGWFLGCGVLATGAVFIDVKQSAWLPRRTLAYGGGGVRLGGEIPLVPHRFALGFTVDVLAPFAPLYATANDVTAWTGASVSATFGARFVASF